MSVHQESKAVCDRVMEINDHLFPEYLFDQFPSDLVFIMYRTRMCLGALAQSQTTFLENFFAFNGFYDSGYRLEFLLLTKEKSTGRPLQAGDDLLPGECLQNLTNGMFARINVICNLTYARLGTLAFTRKVNDGFDCSFTGIAQHDYLPKNVLPSGEIFSKLHGGLNVRFTLI